MKLNTFIFDLFSSRLFVAIALVLFGVPTNADIKVIEMKSRSAQEIIPIIQPHLPSDVSLSAQSMKLIVSGTRQQIDQVEHLLQSLDQPLKQYVVSLRTIDNAGGQSDEVDTSLRITPNNRQFRVQKRSSTNNDASNIIQSLRATEGYPAHIQTTRFILFSGKARSLNHHFNAEIDDFYLDIQSIDQRHVALWLHQKQNTTSHDQVSNRSLDTRIEITMDEWHTLGEVRQSQHHHKKKSPILTTDQKQRELTKTQYFQIKIRLDE